MQIGVITLFPAMFSAITDYGVVGNAIKNGLVKIGTWTPRDFANNNYRNIDDRPYGGGSGMLLSAEPLISAIAAAKSTIGKDAAVFYLSPQGRKLKQSDISDLVKLDKIILICGRYKGIDERVIATQVDAEWSIGDYILSGGELPAMVMIDSISRAIPGVLGNLRSVEENSFSSQLLDCPHYTKPYLLTIKFGQEVMKYPVPSTLMSGNHDRIRRWRLKQALGRTWLRRKDLLKQLNLSNEQKKSVE